MRQRGSSLCDLAILVIDITHGLEPQTIESLEMLKQRRCNFIIALNKVDRMFSWESQDYTAFRPSLEGQPSDHAKNEFEKRLAEVQLQLAEKGLNTYLYWKNPDLRKNVSIIPTSAITGEGVPDLLYMVLKLSQTAMPKKLMIRPKAQLECTVIEVKTIEGLGTTADVILVNGELSKGDTIVVAGQSGPIVTQIRALLTPEPLRDYINHPKISTSMGIKICANGLELAAAGCSLRVCNNPDDLEEVKDDVDTEYLEMLEDNVSYEKSDLGVYVMASTLGSLEALLSFLKSMGIPVSHATIGTVHKRDVKKAQLMREKGKPEYACILAFDVKVDADATKESARSTVGVKIFSADIIYHLQQKFETYMAEVREIQKQQASGDAVFPGVVRICNMNTIFRKKDPIIVGVDVLEGSIRLGTPLCVPDQNCLEIGKIDSIEKERKSVDKAVKGESVCIRITPNGLQSHIMLGRHFSTTQDMYSKITRGSIDVLKDHYMDEMSPEDWKLVVSMKKIFNIQ